MNRLYEEVLEDDEPRYNVHCRYEDNNGVGEYDGDPRNDRPIPFDEAVKLMKKLMDDFKAGKLYGSYHYSPTSKYDDAWRIMCTDDDTYYVKNRIIKEDGQPKITLTYDADMALNWETEQEAKDFMNEHMAEIEAREVEDIHVVQGDGYDEEPCYLTIKAYPDCDTDTLIMKSYDWKTRDGFEVSAEEIYP